MDFPLDCKSTCKNGEPSIEFLFNKTREKQRCPKFYDTKSPPFSKMLEQVGIGCNPKYYVLCSYCPAISKSVQENDER